ncbi:MscL family protein [Mycoplasma enhydrae]|uniref:large conductance mechanosensitive channel protein MscL n=1 Tax=Mycoplasma enhydrae TaxID=2499220 RepID=UPI00197B84B3|nr:MscL family protein [Mycoplasma enhydrae]MBN4089301.1 MscL family protein [Mycoplasma enhydrae]MCV3733539.1 MscL family protein [Mycoplasma enhydrae]MCV3753485.1 MscL family protein [Mycoplasma enhydrae]
MTKKELEEKKHYCKKSFKDAKAVIVRGNMFMLAIGLLLGAAFGAVVNSLANDVIMAAIANVFKVDNLAEWKVGPVLIGKFLAALLSFVIVATFIFIGLFLVFFIRNLIQYKKAKKQPIEPEAEPAPTTEEMILEELKKINSELSKKNQK